MATPKQARARVPAARSSGGGGKSRNKGTRGGRPEPVAAPASAVRNDAGAGARAGGRRRQPAAAAPEPAPAGTPLWLRLSTLVLSLAGFGVALWLTIAHYTTASILACSGTGLIDCGLVTTSPESVLFGIFPVAVLGLAFFIFMVAVTSPWAWRSPRPAVRWARLGSAVAGMVFVLYLVYTELITLDHICLWCTSVHVITFLLFCLIVFSSVSVTGPPRTQGNR